jgi:hypothetical protein
MQWLFYPDDSASTTRDPQPLVGLLTQTQEVILTNMRKAASLTLRMLLVDMS